MNICYHLNHSYRTSKNTHTHKHWSLYTLKDPNVTQKLKQKL